MFCGETCLWMIYVDVLTDLFCCDVIKKCFVQQWKLNIIYINYNVSNGMSYCLAAQYTPVLGSTLKISLFKEFKKHVAVRLWLEKYR